MVIVIETVNQRLKALVTDIAKQLDASSLGN